MSFSDSVVGAVKLIAQPVGLHPELLSVRSCASHCCEIVGPAIANCFMAIAGGPPLEHRLARVRASTLPRASSRRGSDERPLGGAAFEWRTSFGQAVSERSVMVRFLARTEEDRYLATVIAEHIGNHCLHTTHPQQFPCLDNPLAEMANA